MSVAAALESVVVAAVDMLGKPQERGEPLEPSEPRLVAVEELRGSVPQSGRRRRRSRDMCKHRRRKKFREVEAVDGATLFVTRPPVCWWYWPPLLRLPSKLVDMIRRAPHSKIHIVG